MQIRHLIARQLDRFALLGRSRSAPATPEPKSPECTPTRSDGRTTLDILDRLAQKCEEFARYDGANRSTTLRQLACHYADCAERVAATAAFATPNIMYDEFPEDDGSLEFVHRVNVFVVGGEAEIDPDRVRFPWAHLFSDAACGIFLVCGQSNAANHGEGLFQPREEVRTLNFMTLRSYVANDPLPGASGSGGSIWSRLGDLLLEGGFFERVLFVPIAFGGTYVADWTTEGRTRRRLTLALSRLRKRLGTAFLDFDAVFWQQGEAEANLTDISAATYAANLGRAVMLLRSCGVFCPVFVAQSTVCNDPIPHPFRNHAAIRAGQLGIVDISTGILRGPDTDLIGPSGRRDGCHFAEAGLREAAYLWLKAIEDHRHLLITRRRALAGC